MDFVPIRRRFILASEKREPGDKTPATIVDLAPDDATPEEPTAVEPAPAATPAPAPAASAVRLSDRPLSELLGRFRPWDREFWRSVRRRAGRALR